MATKIVGPLCFKSDLQKLTRNADGGFADGACGVITDFIIKLFETPTKEQTKMSFLTKTVVLFCETASFKSKGNYFDVEAFGFLSYSFGQCVSCMLTAIEDCKKRELLEDKIFTLIFIVQDCFDEDVQFILNKFPPEVREFYKSKRHEALSEQESLKLNIQELHNPLRFLRTPLT